MSLCGLWLHGGQSGLQLLILWWSPQCPSQNSALVIYTLSPILHRQPFLLSQDGSWQLSGHKGLPIPGLQGLQRAWLLGFSSCISKLSSVIGFVISSVFVSCPLNSEFLRGGSLVHVCIVCLWHRKQVEPSEPALLHLLLNKIILELTGALMWDSECSQNMPDASLKKRIF